MNPPEQEKKIPLSLSTKRGLTIMSKIDISKLKNEFINKENLKKIADTDKVLLTFLFFNEFEKEYSFILTTNKIKFNTTYNEKGKIDFHKTLSALYDQTRPCKESFEEYFHSIETYEKARSERPISNAQYIQYAKNLSILEKEKIKKGRITRHIIKTFLENVAKNLDLLVKDMDTKNNFISNPQDVLDFDLKIEGEKKLNGKKIHQAISYVFDYISAYSYRLSTEGDLTGETEENSNQYEPLLEEKNINEEKNEPVLDLKAKSNINESKKENSVLEELNKIL